MKRWPKKPPKLDWYLTLIAQTRPDFQNDGLSGGFPDWFYRLVLRYDIGIADRPHAWHYCTRCHPEKSMTKKMKRYGDRALRQHARELLPWFYQIAPIVLHVGVRVGGNSSWDSCGPDVGEHCRHNIKKPVWMQASGDA